MAFSASVLCRANDRLPAWVTACVAGFVFMTFITLRQTVEDSKNEEFYR